MSKALAKAQNTGISAVIETIERVALNPEVNIEKMERLLAMQERILLKNSEAEFNAAMTAAQSEMCRVAADAENPQTRSKYASYAALDRVLRPIYTKHGFSLSFDTGAFVSGESIEVLCHVSHIAGHSRTYKAPMPADGKGAKGGDVMTKTHATGAAMSYGMRYLLKLVFNVAVGEDDTDGNEPIQTITEQQALDIGALIEEIGGARSDKLKASFLNFMKVNKISDIPAQAHADAVAALERKRKVENAANT